MIWGWQQCCLSRRKTQSSDEQDTSVAERNTARLKARGALAKSQDLGELYVKVSGITVNSNDAHHAGSAGFVGLDAFPHDTDDRNSMAMPALDLTEASIGDTTNPPSYNEFLVRNLNEPTP
ncbi:hypothetical protein HDU81_007199 [Chytriomyces hyalinus]|nr:hypothetical protein HDU81_007199 [Chytriomyces hyalinus]